MRTRLPIQAKSTAQSLKSILPESFKMVWDKNSNGYKYLNLLFGVELDQATEFFKDLYSNSFFPTMDFGTEGYIYEAIVSGITQNQYLSASGIPIKIVNNGSPGGESEFWDGEPTRIIPVGLYDISGIITSGYITGLNYFRSNPSGFGYFLVNTNIDQAEYATGNFSCWKLNLSITGLLLSYTGLWPGVETQDYDTIGSDEVLTPRGSGFLSSTYPLTRRIRDDSGVYWNIDAYEPYHGWVRDYNGSVVAKIDYYGDFFYDPEGIKCYYRVALNNPYGSGNYTTEYLTLKNTPISGTLHVYDLDILDISGNATEIPSSGKTLYTLKSDLMLAASGTPSGLEAKFDPIYVGYDETVPDTYTFGIIAGQTAETLMTTSWSYQGSGGYLDEGTHQWVEGSGSVSNQLKLVNPYSRYLVEYKYKVFDTANYVTSVEGSRYVNYDSFSPLFTNSDSTRLEEVPYEFTRDPKYAEEKAKYITFDGWQYRPGSKLSRIDFSLPILIETQPFVPKAFQTRDTYIGYSKDFVPLYHAPRNYILDCPFDNVVSLGTCTEDDLSGSGNTLEWYNDGDNYLYRSLIDGKYGKTTRYVNNSGYFYINDVAVLADVTYFQFEFRLFNPSVVTLMEYQQETDDRYIKVQILDTGMLQITSNGSIIQSRYRFNFDGNTKGLILRVHEDRDYTTKLVFEVYCKDSTVYTKQICFVKDTSVAELSGTFLHVMQNSSMDFKNFKIWREASEWQV